MRLAEFMEAHGVTQLEVAAAAEAAPATVRALMRGERTRQLDVAERVSAATDGAVPVGELYDPTPIKVGRRRRK